jgi:hypothetical protein
MFCKLVLPNLELSVGHRVSVEKLVSGYEAVSDGTDEYRFLIGDPSHRVGTW